jgi:hypothetical protein
VAVGNIAADKIAMNKTKFKQLNTKIMVRKISEWLRMIADPEIRKNAWENWKNTDRNMYPDHAVYSVQDAINLHCDWHNTPQRQGDKYWAAVWASDIALLEQPIPESEMDALNADPLDGGQKDVGDIDVVNIRKHEEMRRKLWCDVAIKNSNPLADAILEAFDERFPNYIN